MFRFGIDLNVAAGLLHKPVDHGQAEPGALAGRLGGEERLEDPPLDLLTHAHAGVAHRELDIFPGRRVGMILDIVLAQDNVVRFDGQRAAARHGVARVDGQIQQHVLQQVAIGPDRPQIRPRRNHDINGLAQGALQQVAHAGHQFIDIDDRRFQYLLTGEASSRRVSSAAPSAADNADMGSLAAAGSFPSLRCNRSRLPKITVSRLLKSCATPPVNWPTASIFCDCASCSSMRRETVMSVQEPTTSMGWPPAAGMTRKVSLIQRYSPFLCRKRYTRDPPPCCIRLSISDKARLTSSGCTRASQNLGSLSISCGQ